MTGRARTRAACASRRSTTARRPSARGIEHGRRDRRGRRPAARGPQLGRGGRRCIKGPPGTRGAGSPWQRGGKRVAKTSRARRCRVPVVASQMRPGRRVQGRRSSRLAQFSSGAHGEVVRRAASGCRSAGAKAFVLDLRGNGGGLVAEAQLVASAFLRGGHDRHDARAARVPERTLDATGDPIVPKPPSSCSSTAAPRRRRRSSPARCRTASARRSSGTRTFGKGVFQEVLELSNGGALDITAGQYFTPSGRNLGGGGVKTGSGHHSPTCRPRTTRRRKPRRGAGRALASWRVVPRVARGTAPAAR